MPQNPLPQNHTIRPMDEADLTSVLTIESASQEHSWTARQFIDELHNEVSSIDLYCCEDEPAAFLCSWLIAGELQIQNIAVAPGFRRRGIAARLMQFVMERSRRAGLDSAWLEVRCGNHAAITLYKGLGFKTVDCRKGYYRDGEDALIMTYQAS